MGWPKGKKRTPAQVKAAKAGRAKSLRAKNGKEVQLKTKVQPARRKVLLRNLAKARAARWAKKPAPKGCAYTIRCGLIEGQLAGPSGEVKFSGKLNRTIDVVALGKLLKGMVT